MFLQVKCCDVCQHTKRKFDYPASTIVAPNPCVRHMEQNRNRPDHIAPKQEWEPVLHYPHWLFLKVGWSTEAEPIPTKEAEDVAVFLYKMILRHGCPSEIVSDQGREFCNHFVDLLEELTGFKHKMTNAYHPQSNGLDECFNQTLNQRGFSLTQLWWDDIYMTVWRTSKWNISFKSKEVCQLAKIIKREERYKFFATADY